jgi:hypothetical protein
MHRKAKVARERAPASIARRRAASAAPLVIIGRRPRNEGDLALAGEFTTAAHALHARTSGVIWCP